ncbi:MAG: hypothetical protein KAS35_01785 [Candidatus Marinimicrobia bacterium]|nr:hypothetical protein [Candidatus Neomarinimicrobiota bacterium]
MRKIITILIVLSTTICAEDLIKNVDNRFAMKLDLTNLNSGSEIFAATSDKYQITPLKPMIASLVIPGLGQYINRSPLWKTALFACVEVASISGYISWINKADDITKEYENWADDHWDMRRWVNDSAILLSDIQSGGYPDVNDVRIDGSHHITIIINGKYESSEILLGNPNIEYVELRDWDFYEGVGKYDQFVAGWDDAKSNWEIVQKKIKEGEDEVIVMTPNKQHYLQLRNDSNVLYKNAKFAVSALLFNHIFSALDALWNANKNKELSYNLDVSIGSESNYVIKGISVQWNL